MGAREGGRKDGDDTANDNDNQWIGNGPSVRSLCDSVVLTVTQTGGQYGGDKAHNLVISQRDTTPALY